MMTKKIYLLRHAKSDHPRGVDDHERPLNMRGKENAQKIGKYIAEHLGLPGIVLCSTAKRTTQTLQMLSRSFESEINTHYLKQLYLATPGEMLKEVSKVDNAVESIMLLAHNPGIHQLGVLLTGHVADKIAYDKMRLGFPTCALAVLSTDISSWKDLEPGFCTLEHFVVPKEI